MNTARMLTAAAAFALIAGSAAAQTTSNTTTTGQPADAQGMTPATDDTNTDANRQTPPVTPGDTATGNASQPAGTMSGQGTMGAQGTMNSGSMPAQPMAQGSMSSSMTAPACLPPVGAAASGGMSGTGPSIAPATMTASANGLIMCTSGTGTIVVSNAPIPDSPDNRARTGGPESRAGKMTAPRPGVTTRSRRNR